MSFTDKILFTGEAQSQDYHFSHHRSLELVRLMFWLLSFLYILVAGISFNLYLGLLILLFLSDLKPISYERKKTKTPFCLSSYFGAVKYNQIQ